MDRRRVRTASFASRVDEGVNKAGCGGAPLLAVAGALEHRS